MTIETRFPEVVDNTMREAFFTCPKKFYYSFVRNLAPKNPSVHLHAGAAFASGLEVARKSFYDQGVDAEEAIHRGILRLYRDYGDFEAPLTGSGANKTADRMAGAMLYYFEQWPLGEDFLVPYKPLGHTSALEFTFSIPLSGFNHPDTGNPLLYGGRFDELGVMNNNTLMVVDEKTTSQLGASWNKQWDLNSQFTGYVWAAQTYGYEVAGAIIRGLSILKNDYGHAQVIIYRPQWILDRWEEQVSHDLSRMVQAYTTGYFDLALGAACNSYGGCPFSKLCQVPNPEDWIPLDFVERNWNPMLKIQEGE